MRLRRRIGHVDATLPLDRMTVEEKLKAVEVLWDDLRRNEKQIPDERQRQIDAGEANP